MRVVLALLALIGLAATLVPHEVHPDEATPEGRGVPVLRSWDAAHEAARIWRSDATLLFVATIESRDTSIITGPGAPPWADALAQPDSYPGNGRTPAWVYAYQDTERDPFFVVIDQNGTVTTGTDTTRARTNGTQVDQHWWPFGYVGGVVVPKPPIDSDTIANLLAKTNDTWKENVGQQGTEVYLTLSSWPHAYWSAFIANKYHRVHQANFVDAQSGVVMSPDEFLHATAPSTKANAP